MHQCTDHSSKGPTVTAHSDGIIPDTKDWTIVLSEPCTQCGANVSEVNLSQIAAQLPQKVAGLVAVLVDDDAARRTQPGRWSKQEYVVHVAQMLQVMVARLDLMLTQDAPTFPNWDQDEAAQAGKYNELSPQQAQAQLEQAAAQFSGALAAIDPADYSRSGLRSNGAAFTVVSLAQYAWHDVLHHLWDVETA